MTSPLQATDNQTEISIGELLSGLPVLQANSHAQCDLFCVQLQEGLDLLLWQGELQRPLTMQVRDDWGRMNFSCSLLGESRHRLAGKAANQEQILRPGMGCINYTPDCKSQSSHGGKFATLTVSINPELLRQWHPHLDMSLCDSIDDGCYYAPYGCNAEMRATAQTLSHAINLLRQHPPGNAARSPLWLLGQSLVMVGLALEGAAPDGRPPSRLHQADHQKLLRARDLLLADLSQAPTIAALSKETGLSVLKLKRGFRELFNNSVYGLFQSERMQEARRRLAHADRSVMTVASDLGYANASHFTAAFQKQFGVTPSAFKRRA